VRQPAVRALLLLATAELLAMTLWFSATAVMPALVAAWALTPTGAAWLTAAVQAGFVVGALGSAVFNLPDVLPPRRMFALAAVAGALVNLLLAWSPTASAPRSSFASSPAWRWPASIRPA